MAILKMNLGHGNPNERASGAVSPLRMPAAARSACLLNILKRRGQQAIEYAVVIAAISAALTAMFVYAKRGLQQHIREVTTHEIGPQVDSSPLSDAIDNVSSVSVMATTSADDSRSRVLVDGMGGTIHQTTYASNSTSSGVATTEQEAM